jgi:hypothetical protein
MDISKLLDEFKGVDFSKEDDFNKPIGSMTSLNGVRRPSIDPDEFNADLTDPRNHDSENFCYIVHAINSAAQMGFKMEMERLGKYDPSQDINLLVDPARISLKKLISGSIISDEQMETFCNVFFILEVPWNNILDMSYSDRGSQKSLEEELKQQQLPYEGAREFARNSKIKGLTSEYNEIIFTGNRDGNQVRVVGAGIVYKRSAKGEILYKTDETEFRNVCNKYGISIIELFNDPKPIEEKPVEFYRNVDPDEKVYNVCLNNNNVRYVFEGSFDEGNFRGCYKTDEGDIKRGKNLVTRKEYLGIRDLIFEGVKTKSDESFVAQIDAHFNIE